MKLLPGIDTENSVYGMSHQQDITIAILAYISILAYLGMLCLEIHNVYFYLLKQGKYKVYPVLLFYLLAIPCTIMRIYNDFYITLTDIYFLFIGNFPAAIKACIGLTQILMVVELTIRVKQSTIVFSEAMGQLNVSSISRSAISQG